MIMIGQIRFKQELDKNKYLSFGGYGMRINNTDINLDFETYYGYINAKDPHILEIEMFGLDETCTCLATDNAGSKKIVDFLENNKLSITEISEFCVYSPDTNYEIEAIEQLAFLNTQGSHSVPKDVLEKAEIVYLT